MTWASDNAPALIAAGVSFFGALGAGIAKVWQLFQQGRLDCLERLRATEAELKAERLEHWKTALALASLQGKLERERAGSSRPPPR